jgi:hypothetical protein
MSVGDLGEEDREAAGEQGEASGEAAIQCGVCGRDFGSRSGLRRHLKGHHPPESGTLAEHLATLATLRRGQRNPHKSRRGKATAADHPGDDGPPILEPVEQLNPRPKRQAPPGTAVRSPSQAGFCCSLATSTPSVSAEARADQEWWRDPTFDILAAVDDLVGAKGGLGRGVETCDRGIGTEAVGKVERGEGTPQCLTAEVAAGGEGRWRVRERGTQMEGVEVRSQGVGVAVRVTGGPALLPAGLSMGRLFRLIDRAREAQPGATLRQIDAAVFEGIGRPLFRQEGEQVSQLVLVYLAGRQAAGRTLRQAVHSKAATLSSASVSEAAKATARIELACALDREADIQLCDRALVEVAGDEGDLRESSGIETVDMGLGVDGGMSGPGVMGGHGDPGANSGVEEDEDFVIVSEEED